MTPIVALVGRPNVGKSTLFNALTKTRDALVADFPGLTRDRKYGMASHNGKEYVVIDTGGLEGGEEGIEYKMVEQSLLAIEEADMVFFLVDAKAGLLPGDRVIAEYLRKREKPIIVVANKTDGVNVDLQVPEFYELSIGEIYSIAASQNRGIGNLIEEGLFKAFDINAAYNWDDEEKEEHLNEEEIRELDREELESEIDDAHDFYDHQIKVALIGRPNVGKSTLTNSLLNEERVIVFDEPGTTRDSTYIPLEVHGRKYVLIDTAGVRKKSKVHETIEKFSVVKTIKAIEDANVCCLVIDANEGISDQDLSLLGFILNAGRSIVLLINKWDQLSKNDRDFVKDELDRRLGFIDFARIHFISALKGHGVGQVLDFVQEAYASAMIRINTSMVTKILQMAVDNHQPPMVGGRRIKMKYAHVGGHNPPIIVIHGNQLNRLPPSYKKYIINYYLKTLRIYGTPIKIQYQESSNPYEGIKNKLSASQLRKKKRLIKFSKKG